MIIQTQPPNFSQRARELFQSLPKGGSLEQRWQEASRSVDTLCREFSRQSEAQIPKLTRTLADKLKTRLDQEALLRAGLEAAANGCVASGAGLAGLGLKLASLAPSEQRQRLEKEAWQDLSSGSEFQELEKLRKQASPGWFQEPNPALEGALLHSAACALDQSDAVLQILSTPIQGKALSRLVASQTSDPLMQSVFASQLSESKKREFARQLLSQPEATGSQRARLALDQKILNQPVMNAIAGQLRTEGNASAKFLALASALQDTKPMHIANYYALQAVNPEGKHTTPRELISKAVEMAQFSNGYHHPQLVALTEELALALPAGQWKQAAQVLARTMDFECKQPYLVQMRQLFSQCLGDIAATQEGQSPLLAACHSIFSIRLEHEMILGTKAGLEKEFAAALALATEPSDLETLSECLRICRQPGNERAALKQLGSFEAAQGSSLEPADDSDLAPIPPPPGQSLVW